MSKLGANVILCSRGGGVALMLALGGANIDCTPADRG